MPSFGAKRIMWKNWWMAGLAALMIVSCEVEQISRRPDGNREDIWTGPGIHAGGTSREVCYVTCFDYPEEYDWRMDPERGSVKCSLVVFADGLPMMKVPVGDAYEVSPDPDMHRIIKGHLYTDYSTGTETVIKKDGKTVLRYVANEVICGMIVEKDTIYTLAHLRGGDGFTFRKNGEVILERPSGRTFRRLHRDGDQICFAFTEPVEAGEESIERYYHCADGVIVQAAVRDDVKKVWDIMSIRGDICYIASLRGVEKPVLAQDGRLNALAMPDGAEPLAFKMIQGEDSLFMEGLYVPGDRSVTSALWLSPGKCVSFDEGMVANSCIASGDGICCAFNPSSQDGIIYRGGEVFQMPAGYAVMGTSCGAVIDGILHMGLSSSEGEPPMVWKDGELQPLDICGYITSVSSY